MKYTQITEGRFLSRPNRFIALVEIDGIPTVCHVKNTGRCKELLLPGARVFLEKAKDPARKTAYDLVGVVKNGIMVNMDSQAPNKVAGEWIQKGGLGFVPMLLKAEYRQGDSRFDFYAKAGQAEWLIEVKGVTLEVEGVAMFPDAPTERGVKHLNGLIQHVKNGGKACALFVIQMQGTKEFRPNRATHAAFAQALQAAHEAGVQVIAATCNVTPDTMEITGTIPVKL